MPGDIIFLYIHVYHKWRSYDTWFSKYKMQPFFPFQPSENPENPNF